MKIDTETLKRLVRGAVTARSDEIGCDDCFRQIDQFVDLELEGRSPAEAMPLVQDHLSRCEECREEYEALLNAVRALS